MDDKDTCKPMSHHAIFLASTKNFKGTLREELHGTCELGAVHALK